MHPMCTRSGGTNPDGPGRLRALPPLHRVACLRDDFGLLPPVQPDPVPVDEVGQPVRPKGLAQPRPVHAEHIGGPLPGAPSTILSRRLAGASRAQRRVPSRQVAQAEGLHPLDVPRTVAL